MSVDSYQLELTNEIRSFAEKYHLDTMDVAKFATRISILATEDTVKRCEAIFHSMRAPTIVLEGPKR
jgi:hypothetical protein